MIILTLNRDKSFARATGKVLVISSSNIIIYTAAVSLCYPAFGIALGTLISFLISFIYIWVFIPLIKKIL